MSTTGRFKLCKCITIFLCLILLFKMSIKTTWAGEETSEVQKLIHATYAVGDRFKSQAQIEKTNFAEDDESFNQHPLIDSVVKQLNRK